MQKEKYVQSLRLLKKIKFQKIIISSLIYRYISFYFILLFANINN